MKREILNKNYSKEDIKKNWKINDSSYRFVSFPELPFRETELCHNK